MRKYLIFVLASISLFRCGPSPLSGGVSDTGNIRVSAVMYNQDGSFAAGVPVTLCPSDYLELPDDNQHNNEKKVTVTNDSGYFCIDSLEPGTYSIEINDRKSSAFLFRINLDLSDTVFDTLLSDTLRPYASVKGQITVASNSAPLYCSIYGLERTIKVDTSGVFEFKDLPEGDYVFVITSEDTLFNALVIDDITAIAGELIELPFVSWTNSRKLILNTSPSGADVAGTVAEFPVLVRLNSSNFDFSSAASDGSDLRFTKPNGRLLPHEIEYWNSSSGLANIWVKVDTIKGNDSTQYILMFWGKNGVPEVSSSTTVFDTTDGFQGVWHLSDLAEEKAVDATVNHHDGVVSSVKSTAAVIGQGGELDTPISYITFQGTADGKLNFPENSSYTVSAWVFALDSSSGFIVGKGNYQYHLRIKEGHWLFAQYTNQPSPSWESTTCPIDIMTWHHVTGVREGERQYLYIDGICVDSTIELVTGDSSRMTDFDVEIGRRNDPLREDSQPFRGMIDEVRLSSIARSSHWIRLCYMNQKNEGKLVRIVER